MVSLQLRSDTRWRSKCELKLTQSSMQLVDGRCMSLVAGAGCGGSRLLVRHQVGCWHLCSRRPRVRHLQGAFSRSRLSIEITDSSHVIVVASLRNE